MLPRLPYDGAVDADGHVLEPPDLWDNGLEPRFRDRPMGIRRDAEGREYLEIAAGGAGRLVPIAHLSLGLPEEAERELERAARDGVKGVFIAPFVMTRKAPGHPDHHRVFRLAEELGLPVAIHPGFEPFWAA